MILVKVFLIMAGLMVFAINAYLILLGFICRSIWAWAVPSPKNPFSSSKNYWR